MESIEPDTWGCTELRRAFDKIVDVPGVSEHRSCLAYTALMGELEQGD